MTQMNINKLLKNWFNSPFWKGVATLSDITGSLSKRNSRLELTRKAKSLSTRNSRLTPEQADYLALLSDWESVGDDLRTAIKRQKTD